MRYVKIFVFFLGGVALSLNFVSCGNPRPYLNVLQGNYSYGQGHYQPATVRYLSALKYEEYRPWIQYNLGNVYHSLGESEEALKMWNEASKSNEEDILFGVSFNRGVLYYEMGRYNEAYREFKYALQLDSSNMEAKINLELCYRKIKGGQSSIAGSGNGRSSDESSREEENDTQTGKQSISDESKRILEYIRKKEGQRWFATEEIKPEDFQRDW